VSTLFLDIFTISLQKLFNSLGERKLMDVIRIIRKAISNNNGYQAILGSMVRLAAQFFPRREPYPTVDILIYGNNSPRRQAFVLR